MLFDLSGAAASTIELQGTLTPADVVVHNPAGHDYTFGGSGQIAGSTNFMKSGAGRLTLGGNHSLTGKTTVNQGELRLAGNLTSSAVAVQGLGRLSGSGTIASLTTAKRASVSPGTGPGNIANLAVTGTTTLSGTTLEFDLPANGTQLHDAIRITAGLTLSGTNPLVFRVASGNPTPGTYPLITFTGTPVGGLANLQYDPSFTTVQTQLVVGPGVINLIVLPPPPAFDLSATTGYEGDPLTLDWQVPVGCTAITLQPGNLDLIPDTHATTGIGSRIIEAHGGPETDYILTYVYPGNTGTLTRSFTTQPSFLNASASHAVEDQSPVSFTWKIPGTWDQNPIPANNAVFLRYGPPSGFTGGPAPIEIDVTAKTTTSGFSSSAEVIIPQTGQTEYRLYYKTGGVERFLINSIIVGPRIFTFNVINTTGTGTSFSPSTLQNGVVAYGDRTHVWSAVPPQVQGAQFIRMLQGDKSNASLAVRVTATQDLTLLLLIDNRIGDGIGNGIHVSPPDFSTGKMPWVLASGFVDSGIDVGIDENPVPGFTEVNSGTSVYLKHLSSLIGDDALPGSDPDGDGTNNLGEFAFGSNPASGANDGHIIGKHAQVNGSQAFTCTLPARSGAVFTNGAPATSAAIDGIVYQVQAGPDLDTWTIPVETITGPDATAIQSTLPPLPPGYTYHSFRLDLPPGTARAFIRAHIAGIGG